MKTTKLINLTPHRVVIYDTTGALLCALDPDGTVARVETFNRVCPDLEVGPIKLPVTIQEPGPIVGLPAPQDGVAYVVSMAVRVAAVAPIRRDVYSPGPLMRDPAGQPVGCIGLVSN